jgi:hypothetical protein
VATHHRLLLLLCQARWCGPYRLLLLHLLLHHLLIQQTGLRQQVRLLTRHLTAAVLLLLVGWVLGCLLLASRTLLGLLYCEGEGGNPTGT